MPRTGDTIGAYELLELVSAGPISTIFRARDTRLGRLVALRVMSPELFDDPVVRARLNREATALAKFNHPNVPTIYNAEERDDTLVVVTAWIDGTTLDALVAEQGPLELRRAVFLVNQVASAVDMAHKLGLIHRAVTASHVLVRSEDHAYLTDFGVARPKGDVIGLTDPGALAATVESAAPELIRGAEADARTDIYGLGLVLYEALAGEPPFGAARTAVRRYAQAAEEVPSLSALRSDVPPELDEVVRTALAKRPEERQASAEQFARQAAAAIGVPGPEWASVPSSPHDASAGVPVDGQPAAGRRRRRALHAALALVALALFVAAPLGLLQLLQDTDAGPHTERIAAGAFDVAAANGRIWVATRRQGVVTIPDTGARGGEQRVLPSRPDVRSLASDGRRVVLASSRTLAAIRSPAGRPALTRLPAAATAVAAGAGSYWAATGDGTTLLRARDDGVSSVPLLRPTTAIAVSPTRVWVLSKADGTVLGVNPETLEAETDRLRVGRRPVALAATRAAVWVVLEGSGELIRLDPRNGRPRGVPIPVSGRPTAVAADARDVWVTRSKDDAVDRIDARTGRPLEEIGTAAEPVGVALTRDAAWVVGSRGDLTRIPR